MLVIKKLVLSNFGILKGKHTFNFKDGFNIINGRNGHGKSTILEAFNILLFNDYEGSYDSRVNNQSNNFNLDLSFDIDDIPYRITFDYKKETESKGKSTKVLYREDKQLASGEEAVKTMAELLDANIGPYAFSFKQDGTSRVTSCGDASRRDILRKLWEIDYTKKIEKVYGPKIKALKDQVKSIDEQVYAIENYQYNTIPILEPPVEDYVYENEKSAAEEIRSRLKMITSLRESNSSWQKQYDASVAAIDSANANIQKLEDDITNYQNYIDRSVANRTLDINTAKEKFDNEKAKLEESKKALENEIQELKSKTFMIQRLPNISNINVDATRDALSNKQAELNVANRNLAVLKTGVCPTCGSNCTHKTEEFKQTVETLTKEVDELQKQYDNETALVDKYNTIESNNERLNLEKSNNDTIIQLKEKTLADTVSVLEKKSFDDEYNRIMSSYNESVKAYTASITSNQGIIENYKRDIEKYENDKVTAQNNIKEIELTEDDETLEERLNTIENEIKQYETIIAQNETAAKHNAEIEVLKQENEAKAVELRNLRIQVVEETTEYEIASEIMLRKYPLWRVDKGVEGLTNKMNAFIDEVYEKSLDVKFKPDKNVLKMVYGDNPERPLPIMRLSGAERSLVDVAFINVFNQKLGLGCICLDEYDANMDDINKKSAFEAVRNMGNSFNQIFVISHSKDIKNYLLANCKANLITLD